MKFVKNNNCDGACCTLEHGEVRVLPIGGSSNAILCRDCFEVEMRYRKMRNKELGLSFQFKIPDWKELKVYEPGE